MKKIAITGGKGGTGKSTVATALALKLSKNKKVLLIDADIDCPNDHLILKIKRKKVKDIFQPMPVFDLKKCKKCGKCAEICRENAIVQIKGEYPIFIKDQCIGCSACMIACPFDAISKGKRKIGTIYKGKINKNLDYFSGESEIGIEEESPIVNALKKHIKKIEKNYDYILFDTSPGTHCNVISALQGCEFAFSITEPTPLGEHDSSLSLQLLSKLKIPTQIILNKSNIGDKKLIEKLAKKFKIKIISEIPYKKSIMKSYSRGQPIKNLGINKAIEYLKKEN
jgi:MinD superfamily P-loop ATPase